MGEETEKEAVVGEETVKEEAVVAAKMAGAAVGWVREEAGRDYDSSCT